MTTHPDVRQLVSLRMRERCAKPGRMDRTVVECGCLQIGRCAGVRAPGRPCTQRAFDWEGNSHPLPNPPQRSFGGHGGAGCSRRSSNRFTDTLNGHSQWMMRTARRVIGGRVQLTTGATSGCAVRYRHSLVALTALARALRCPARQAAETGRSHSAPRRERRGRRLLHRSGASGRLDAAVGQQPKAGERGEEHGRGLEPVGRA
jgi:hypothetical protein